MFRMMTRRAAAIAPPTMGSGWPLAFVGPTIAPRLKSTAAATAAPKDIGRVSQPKKARKPSPKPKAKSKPAALGTGKPSQKPQPKGLARVTRRAADPAVAPAPAAESTPGPSPPVPKTDGADAAAAALAAAASAAASEPSAAAAAGPAAGEGKVSRTSLLFKSPRLAKEYAATNAVPAGKIPCDTPTPVAWRCDSCQLTWTQSAFERYVLKGGCPHCTRADSAPLSAVAPSIAEELHPTRNDPFLTADRLTSKHREFLWWRCSSCQGEFQARVRARLEQPRTVGACPYCTVAVDPAVLAVLEPEWHPTKNGDLDLKAVLSAPAGTKQAKTPVWWICPSCALEWQAASSVRLRGHGMCPHCNPSRAGTVGRAQRHPVVPSGSDTETKK